MDNDATKNILPQARGGVLAQEDIDLLKKATFPTMIKIKLVMHKMHLH